MRTQAPWTMDKMLTWPRLPKLEIIEDLAHISRELFSSYQELAMLEAEEARGRAEAFARSQEPTVTGRKQEAEAATIPNRIALADVRRRIEALGVARDFGYLLVGLDA